MDFEDKEKEENVNYGQEDQNEELDTRIENIENEHENEAENVKRSVSSFFMSIFSGKKIWIIILILAIVAAIFVGVSYFTKLYGEGNISDVATDFLLNEELGISEAEGKGYYYTLDKDIVEKYIRALNNSYEEGDYHRESLLDFDEDEEEKTSLSIFGEDEFDETLFEEWFNTEDRSIWEPYLIKMFRAEIESSYPKLGSYEGEEGTQDKQGTRKDKDENYVVQGKVEIKRTKINDDGTIGETISLEYMPKDEFDRLIEKNDKKALDYYTFDELAGYLYYATYVNRKYVVNGSTYKTQYRVERSWIKYRDVVSSYSMPFNFLVSLLKTSENPEYVMKVADLVYKDTKIDLMIQDQLKVTTGIETIQDGIKGYNIISTNTTSVFVSKAHTWNTDFEDKVEINKETEEDQEYIDDDGVKVIRQTTNYLAQIVPVEERKINYKKFLGLWKNETGEYVQGAEYKPDGKEVGYSMPPEYKEKRYPAKDIASSNDGEDIDVLINLLSKHENTQIHEQLMKYYWNIYTGENIYKATVDKILSLFDAERFKFILGTNSKDYTLLENLWISLRKAGYNENAASAVIAQIYIYNAKEFKNSTKNVLNISEKKYAQNVDNGKYLNFINDGIAFGIGKWISPERKSGLLNYAKSKGKSIGNMDIQIEYLIAELDLNGTSDASKYATYQLGTYGDSWKNAKTTEDAVEAYYKACIEGIEKYIKDNEEYSLIEDILSGNKKVSIKAQIYQMASEMTYEEIDMSANQGEGDFKVSGKKEVTVDSKTIRYRIISEDGNVDPDKPTLFYIPGAAIDGFDPFSYDKDKPKAGTIDDLFGGGKDSDSKIDISQYNVIMIGQESYKGQSGSYTYSVCSEIADLYDVDQVGGFGHSDGARALWKVANYQGKQDKDLFSAFTMIDRRDT